jgi:predicted nucleic acid-binding protein
LFDAIAAALSRRLKLPVWTFDQDFDLLRARQWR